MAADTSVIGAPGLRQSGGYITEEFLPQLQGTRAVKVFREMAENDAVIGATLFAVKSLVRRTSWTVEPDSSSAEDKLAAGLVEECRGDMSVSWNDMLRDCLTFLDFGYAPHEIVYKLRHGDHRDPSKRSQFTDGRVGWRKLEIRAQSTVTRWGFDEGGSLTGVYQNPPPTYGERFIPIEKMLLFRAGGASGNPEGRSVLRSAYRAWYFGKRIEELEAIGIERDLAGLPLVDVPANWLAPEATPAEKLAVQQAEKIATSVRRNEHEGLVLPAMFDAAGNRTYDVRLLSSGGKRTFDTDKIIGRHDQRKAMCVLADFLLLGHENVGSFALGVSKAELFVTAIEAFLEEIAGVFNRHAIPRLLALNGMHGRCKLKPGQVDRVDLAELGDYIAKLSGAQVLLSDDEIGRFVRRAGGLPEEITPPTDVGKRGTRDFRRAAGRGSGEPVAKAEDPDTDELVLIADALAPGVRQLFLEAVARVRGRVDRAALVRALRAGDIDSAEAALALDAIAEELGPALESIRAAFLEAGTAAAEAVGVRITATVAFNGTSPGAAAWLATRGADLVRGITDQQRTAIRARLIAAEESGRGARTAARAIVLHIGQSERDSAAIVRFEERLRGEGLDERAVLRRTARYARRKLEDRADVIVVNELLEAAGAARHESWTQAAEAGHLGDDLRRKVIPAPDERTCSICAPLAGKTFALDEDIIPGKRHVPLHILCRCPEVLVFGSQEAGANGGSAADSGA